MLALQDKKKEHHVSRVTLPRATRRPSAQEKCEVQTVNTNNPFEEFGFEREQRNKKEVWPLTLERGESNHYGHSL